MSQNEFADVSRPVEAKYHEALEKLQAGQFDSKELITSLQEFIDEDPDYLEPYMLLEQVYTEIGEMDKAEEAIEEAYRRALALITDEKGGWPDSLTWVVTENRHIIRALLQKGMNEWEDRNWDAALELFRNLLRTNPNDNIGARQFLLAVRMGFTFAGFEDRFNKEGYYDSELLDWFEEHAPRYPEEFDWWLKWAKQLE